MKAWCWFVLILVLCGPTSPCKSQHRADPFVTLRKGIETRSDKLMREFFEAWLRASDKLRKKPANKLQSEAEAVFEAVWNPADRGAIEWGTGSNMKAPSLPPYIVFLPSIKVFANSYDTVASDSLLFAVPKRMHGSKTLAYIESYVDSLHWYMSFRSNNHENENFIAKYVSISCHMMGCTAVGEPAIGFIRFRGNTEAVVPYWISMHGAEATLNKINSKWRVTRAGRTGAIE